MQGFCPLCSQNGITAEVKAYQLSFEEAVFMCSNAKCPWPVGCQELTFINRSIGKDWSKSWDKIAVENLNKCSQVDKAVSNLSTTFINNSICVSQEDSSTISNPGDFFFNTNINNGSNLASLPIDLKPVKYTAKASPTNNHGYSDDSSTVDGKSTNIKEVITIDDNSTKIVKDFVPAKTNNISPNLSRLSKVSKGLNLRSKTSNLERVKVHRYKKFSLNKLLLEKPTICKKDSERDSAPASRKVNNENSNEFNKIVNDSENQVNSDSNSILINSACDSETIKNNDSEFNLDDILNNYCNELGTKAEVESKDDFDWIESLLS